MLYACTKLLHTINYMGMPVQTDMTTMIMKMCPKADIVNILVVPYGMVLHIHMKF